jgi:hypothetical protein
MLVSLQKYVKSAMIRLLLGRFSCQKKQKAAPRSGMKSPAQTSAGNLFPIEGRLSLLDSVPRERTVASSRRNVNHFKT